MAHLGHHALLLACDLFVYKLMSISIFMILMGKLTYHFFLCVVPNPQVILVALWFLLGTAGTCAGGPGGTLGIQGDQH